jgi:hypothetical protein
MEHSAIVNFRKEWLICNDRIMKEKIVFICFLLLSSIAGFSQNNVGIGTNAPDTNAILEMKATDKGVLIPRMNSIQRNNMSPVLGMNQKGLMVFDNDSTKFFYWDGIMWRTVGSGAQGPMGIANVQTHGISGAHQVVICGPSYVQIPDLSLTITLVDTATLNIFTCGGLQPSAVGSGMVPATISLFSNNVLVNTAFQTYRMETSIVPWSTTNWSLSTTLRLPSGTYNFTVQGKSAGSNCYYAGANTLSSSSLIIQVFY